MTDKQYGTNPLSVDKVFQAWFDDDSSRAGTGRQPRFVLVTGTPASGKTRLRHEKYGRGYVAVDAGDIFRQIPNSDELDFPGEQAWFIDAVGALVARRAIQERRHIVTEVFGQDQQQIVALIDAMKAVGYRTELVGVRADLEKSIEWNEARGLSNVSSYFTDRFNVRWLTEAARAEAAQSGESLS